jgi:hypothetical protein
MSAMPPNPFGPAAPRPYYHYFWWEAALVALDAVGGLLFAWTGVGALFWLLGFAYAAWRDWRGLSSLRGVLPWSRYARIEQIILALFVIVCAPLLFLVYSFQIVRDALRFGSGRSAGAPSFLGAQWTRMRAWPRAWQVVGVMSALVLICACCGSGLAIIGANSPTTTANGGSGSNNANNLTALTVPQMTATAQALHTTQEAQATQTAQQTVFSAATATALALPTATATPLPTVTPAPTATPRPTPKPQPTRTPVPYVLSIAVTCASAVDYSYGQVCVHTHAGAQLTITVTYCSGHKATSSSLQGTFTANGSGDYTWNWTPQTTCRGSANAFITDDWNGQSVTTDPSFNVQ